MFLSSGSAPVCIIDHLFPKVEQYFLNNSISNKLRFISFGDDNLKHDPKDGIRLYYTSKHLYIPPAAVFTYCLDIYPLPLASSHSTKLHFSDQYFLSFFYHLFLQLEKFHLSCAPSL